MFDRVLRSSDDDATRRSAVSLAFTSALCGAAIGGFLFGSLLFQVGDAEPILVEGPLVFVEPSGGAALQPLPALPELVRTRTPEIPLDPEAEIDPEAHPEVEVPPEVAPPSGGGGTGIEGPGTGDGPPGDGPPGDGPLGTGYGGDGGGGRQFDQPKLDLKRRIEPRYPDVARALGLGEQRCLATVYIGEDGVPTEVEIEGCPEAFHAETRRAMLQWRWYPPKSGRDRVSTRTTVGITYRLDR